MPPALTPTVRATLDLLGRFRFLTNEQLQRTLFSKDKPDTAVMKCNRTMRNLRTLGLADSQYLINKERVHYLTDEGARMLDVEGGHVGVRLSDYEHDKAIVDLCFALEAMTNVDSVVTEREQRSEGYEAEHNQWAVPVIRPSGNKGYAWPDLISLNTNGQIWGHEVEWTPKDRQRMERLMYAYGACERFTGAVYYTTRATQNVVTVAADNMNQVLTEHGYGRQIVVRTLDTIISPEPTGKHAA